MRPYLADLLNRASGTGVFTYLLPNYLIMLCAGAFVGTVYAARRARARGLNPEVFYGLILWALPAALLGGRIMGFLYAPGSYGGSLLHLLDPLSGDSAAYGGFIGGTAAGIAYLLVRRVEVWRFLDCAGPPLGVATAFTRAGCFLDGCDFGSPTACPLAVAFPAGSPAYAEQLSAGLISPHAPSSLPVHPTQLYLALAGVLLAAATAWWDRRLRHPPGETFLGFWVLYAVSCFGLELLRGDAVRGTVGPLSTSQAVSLPVFLAAGSLLLGRRLRARAPAETLPAAAAPATPERASPEPLAAAARGALLETALATLLAALAVKLCVRGGGWWTALVPAVWVYFPLLALWIRRRPLREHGFSVAAWTRGAKWLLAAAPAVLAPFAAAVVLWRWRAGRPVDFHPQRLLSAAALWQLLLVAAPEELFFRGYVQGRLRAWSAGRGGSAQDHGALGARALPIVLAALLFAAAHLAADPSWLAAATFFPGVVLGWLRERSGGLLAPAGLHGLANLTALALGWGL